jgi:hypothetical protein
MCDSAADNEQRRIRHEPAFRGDRLHARVRPLDIRRHRFAAGLELGRRIQLEALAVGFGAAGMLTLAYGFLENAGFPQLSYIWVFPTMIALWGIGGAIASYRYR